MWLFYADNTGYIPMGNDGQMKISPRSSKAAIVRLATTFLGKRRGRVYLMHSWTQQMSELGPAAFEDYIMRNGELVAHS